MHTDEKSAGVCRKIKPAVFLSKLSNVPFLNQGFRAKFKERQIKIKIRVYLRSSVV
jgi:hypothetical protein